VSRYTKNPMSILRSPRTINLKEKLRRELSRDKEEVCSSPLSKVDRGK